jgi:hypothetical protein
MPIDPRQYDSAIDYIDSDAEFSKSIGNMANTDDKLRLKAYELYEDMYNNRPEHMRVIMRGEDEDSVEIYLPSSKKCIEAVNRFLCVNYSYHIEPKVGSPDDQSAIDAALGNLFQKEHFYRKFNQLKRYMLLKGDACFHIVGKPWERDGKKIAIEELKPEHYFPIEDLVTGELMGCHIVDIIRNPRSTPNTKRFAPEFLTRRQTYRREVDENNTPTGRVTSELTLWEIGRWDDRIPFLELAWVDTITEEFYMPEGITRVPVYHFANNPPPTSTFGMSELAGVESLITAINQAISDEDLTLITQGLGVYWTDASPPVDESGNITEWEIGPGAVVEIGAGGKFGRVSGISSVTPYLEHILAMDESMQQAIGVPDIAIGMVDVATAESGIALAFKLGPLLAKNAEKEIFILQVMDEMLDDIVMGWLPAMEGVTVDNVLVTSNVDDPMPKNQSQLLQDLLGIYGTLETVLPVDWVFEQLNEIMGYNLTDADFQQALKDQMREAINQALIQMKTAEITGVPLTQPGQGGPGGQNGSSGGAKPPQPKPAPGVSQIDNLTKYTQSERLSRQTRTGSNFASGLGSALSGGGI